MTQTVTLETAWLFTCPTCGQRNVVEPVLQAVTLAERVEIAAEEDIPPDDVDDEWECEPDAVRCGGCRTEFAVDDDEEADDDDE
jgi:hypothetical protein